MANPVETQLSYFDLISSLYQRKLISVKERGDLTNLAMEGRNGGEFHLLLQCVNELNIPPDEREKFKKAQGR